MQAPLLASSGQRSLFPDPSLQPGSPSTSLTSQSSVPPAAHTLAEPEGRSANTVPQQRAPSSPCGLCGTFLPPSTLAREGAVLIVTCSSGGAGPRLCPHSTDAAGAAATPARPASCSWHHPPLLVSSFKRQDLPVERSMCLEPGGKGVHPGTATC